MACVDPVILQLDLIDFNYVLNTGCLLHRRPLLIKVVKSGFYCARSANSIPSRFSDVIQSGETNSLFDMKQNIGYFSTHTTQNCQEGLLIYYDLDYFDPVDPLPCIGVQIEMHRFPQKPFTA
jgi:hypothetical protein